jgi:hypothetical protein
MDLLTAIVVILIVLWALGAIAIGGPAIHLLLVIAVIVLLVRLVQGRPL